MNIGDVVVMIGYGFKSFRGFVCSTSRTFTVLAQIVKKDGDGFLEP